MPKQPIQGMRPSYVLLGGSQKNDCNDINDMASVVSVGMLKSIPFHS